MIMMLMLMMNMMMMLKLCFEVMNCDADVRNNDENDCLQDNGSVFSDFCAKLIGGGGDSSHRMPS